MLTQKQMREWIPQAVTVFNTFVPIKHMPKVYIAGPKTILKKRAELVEKILCPLDKTPTPYDVTMEMLHGEKGDAVLINQQFVPNGDGAMFHFCHCLWHEFGHYFAIHNECPDGDLHRFNDPNYPSTLAEQYQGEAAVKQTGYWFWAEFIAEAIADYVDEMYCRIYNAKHYHPEQLTWEPHQWGYLTDTLLNYLDQAFGLFSGGIDEFPLAMYFATLLMDDATKRLVKAAENGKLKVMNQKTQRPKLMEPNSIDATCITDVDKIHQKTMLKIKTQLEKQLSKKQFWKIDEDFLYQIGSYIMELSAQKNILIEQYKED